MARPASIDDAIQRLRQPETIRERCIAIHDWVAAGRSPHFAVDARRLPEVVDYVAETTRRNYPDLDVPFHSRWRHFDVGGIDRWAALRRRLPNADATEVARVAFDLIIVSVLLDAGAGPGWRFSEVESGREFSQSEGLAVASFRYFESGALSDDAADPFRADAGALARVDAAGLGAAFQAGAANPMAGLDGRATVLCNLGLAMAAAPDLFGGDRPRLGNLFDALKARADATGLDAREILAALLHGLAPVWPPRHSIGGVNLGDVWPHPAVGKGDATDGLVPFHKLCQWLAYSLVEPLMEAGIPVRDLDALTGLAEYRNGGLFVDLGVIVVKEPALLDSPQAVDSEAIVEWRALTVALLDRLAGPLRDALGVDAADFPLVRLLQGGTWSAGRRIAAARRPDGGPPIRIVSDGTVF